MPRVRSDDKRAAILAAATRLIVTQGLSAPTMKIAKEAGVPNGSLFTYFPTKADLFNQLYLELKSEMAATAMLDVQASEYNREDFFRVWRSWTTWAVAFPEKRKALAQLNVSEEITPETRAAAQKLMRPVREIVAHFRASGSMSKVPNSFVVMLVNSIAEGTMEFMAQDAKNAQKHCKAGFDAVWRMVS